MGNATIRKGNRIERSGQGRTAHWPYGQGIVTMRRHGYIYVVWDGTSFEDEMEPAEVREVSNPPAGTQIHVKGKGWTRTGEWNEENKCWI